MTMIDGATANSHPTAVDKVAGAIADVQREIGRQAGKWSQSAGEAARDVRHDAAKTGQDVTRRAGEQLADAVEPILEQLRGAARDVAENAHNQADELRSLRLTTEPPRGPGYLGWLVLGLGAAIGALVMFLMDPDRGPRRRAQIRDQVGHWANVAQDATGGQLSISDLPGAAAQPVAASSTRPARRRALDTQPDPATPS